MKQAGTGAASSEQIQDNNRTEVHATGDRATIIQGDQIKRQRVRRVRVGTQYVRNMEVRQAPLPAHAKLDPCPVCETLNAPLAPRCTRCNHPIAAERNKAHAFRAERESRYTSAWGITAVVVTGVIALMLMLDPTRHPPGPLRNVMEAARVAIVIMAVMTLLAAWGKYWLHRWRIA